eukprot:338946-Prorocentrum_minimum.AAC.1
MSRSCHTSFVSCKCRSCNSVTEAIKVPIRFPIPPRLAANELHESQVVDASFASRRVTSRANVSASHS